MPPSGTDHHNLWCFIKAEVARSRIVLAVRLDHEDKMLGLQRCGFVGNRCWGKGEGMQRRHSDQQRSTVNVADQRRRTQST